MWDYSKKVKELFLNALYGSSESYLGKLEDYDYKGMYGSIACGDAIIFYIKVKENKKDPQKDRIIKARYQTFGCTSAIASSEALCHLIETQKLTPIEAMKITNQDIVKFLGGMPDAKIHCSIMGAEVLQSTLREWAKKRQVNLDLVCANRVNESSPHSRIVCDCLGIEEREIVDAIKNYKYRTVDDLAEGLKVGSICGACKSRPNGLSDLLQTHALPIRLIPELNDRLDNVNELSINKELVIDVLEKIIRPILKESNIGIDLVEIKGHRIYCLLDGADCDTLQARSVIKNTVEKYFCELVDKNIRVIDI